MFEQEASDPEQLGIDASAVLQLQPQMSTTALLVTSDKRYNAWFDIWHVWLIKSFSNTGKIDCCHVA